MLFERKLIGLSAVLLLVSGLRAAVAPSLESRHGFGQCGLAPYDITEDLIKKNGLNVSEPDEIQKFWRSRLPEAYHYEWSHALEPVATRQAKLEPIKEPVLIRLKVLYDETLAAQYSNVETLERYIKNLLLDVQMVMWQPELFNSVNIQLIVVEMAQLDRRLQLDDTMERILRNINSYNVRADKSVDYYDLVLMFVHRALYDIRPDSSIQPAVGVSNPYTFCNQKKNLYGSRGVLVTVATSTVTVTAHEIGHTLGLMHDGSEPNVFEGTAKCDPREYIMAAFSDVGQTRWSECSVQAMLIYLRSPQVFECVTNQDRTRDAKPLSPQFDWRDPKTIKTLPGQEMPPEQQCTFALGEPALPVREAMDKHRSPWDTRFLDSCKALYCELHGRQISVGPAQDGSDCLTHPEKLQGRCVNRSCLTASYSDKASNSSIPST